MNDTGTRVPGRGAGYRTPGLSVGRPAGPRPEYDSLTTKGASVAHSLSSKKRVRQNARREALNRARRSSLRSGLRKCTESFARGTPQEAEQQVLAACKRLDREANRGTLHRNAAARRKSRLAKRLNALKQKAGGGAGPAA